MLSAIEINELENKVFKYRLKQRIHYFIIVVVVIFVMGIAGVYLYPILAHPTTKVQETIFVPIVEEKTSDNNLSTTIQQPSTSISDVNNSTEYTPTPIKEEKIDQTLFLQLPTIGKTSKDKKSSYIPEPTEKKVTANIQEDELENKILMRKMQSNDEENFYRNQEDKIDATLLPPPPLEDTKPKGMIKIETHEVNSIQYLKDKFEKTHNITFALMLAEEYYIAKNYNESNKWALIANNADSENEKSWIWFAKSKIKLGHKEDAILALKAYLKNNKSQAAQSLLNQINVGEVID